MLLLKPSHYSTSIDSNIMCCSHSHEVTVYTQHYETLHACFLTKSQFLLELIGNTITYASIYKNHHGVSTALNKFHVS